MYFKWSDEIHSFFLGGSHKCIFFYTLVINRQGVITKFFFFFNKLREKWWPRPFIEDCNDFNAVFLDAGRGSYKSRKHDNSIKFTSDVCVKVNARYSQVLLLFFFLMCFETRIISPVIALKLSILFFSSASVMVGDHFWFFGEALSYLADWKNILKRNRKLSVPFIFQRAPSFVVA